jgi:fructoselysine-6-P-deglycase FrlB-like protein
MAYETSNPIKKIGQAGDSNSLWFYTDDDAIAAIAASGYFNSATKELKENDIILCVGSNGGTQTVDILVVSSASGAATVTVVNGS